MLNKNTNKQAMTIIELMIAIFIFTMWISSVFMILTSAGNINSYNKNFIIASNLAREQVELIRNIRDTNYSKFQRWNVLQPQNTNTTDYNKVFTGSTANLYKIENDFSSTADFHIKFKTWSYFSNNDFENKVKTLDPSIDDYRLCLDSGSYVYCEWTTGLKETRFYKYIEIQQLKDWTWVDIEDSFKINSVVYWNIKWVHKVEIATILADYKRL